MDFYRLSLYGLAVAFAAFDANAAATIRASSAGKNSSIGRTSSVGKVGSVRTTMSSGQGRTSSLAGHSRAASSLAKGLPKSTSGMVGIPKGSIGGGNDFTSAIDDLERRKADKSDVYTIDQTDRAIADAIAEIEIAPGVGDISGKADKVADAADGNLAGLGSDGNLKDSGIKASDLLTIKDVGISPGKMVAVGLDGKIDSTLYTQGNSDMPDAPTDGKEYVLLATSDGTKVWARVRGKFVKDW